MNPNLPPNLPPSSKVELLFELGAAIDRPRDTGATPFYIACERGHHAVAAYLADRLEGDGPRAALTAPMADGSTSLFIAAQNGHGAARGGNPTAVVHQSLLMPSGASEPAHAMPATLRSGDRANAAG